MPLWPRQRFGPVFEEAVTNASLWYERIGTAPIVTSAAWTTANRIVYTPVIVPEAVWQLTPYIYSGPIVSGLYILGVYADDGGVPGKLLNRSAATLQIYTSRWETATQWELRGSVPKGLAWLALIFDNTTATLFRLAALTANGHGSVAGIYYEDAVSFALPDVATPVVADIVLNVPLQVATL